MNVPVTPRKGPMRHDSALRAMLPLLAGAGTAALAPGRAQAQRLVNPAALRLEGERVAQLVLQRGDEPAKHYPPAARQAALDGVVVVDLLVNPEGQVLEAQVISESPPGQGFGLAALDTAKTFEFTNRLNRLVLLSMTIEFLP